MYDSRPGTSGSVAISGQQACQRPSTVPCAVESQSGLGQQSAFYGGKFSSDARHRLSQQVCIAVSGSDMEGLSQDLDNLSDGWIKKNAKIPPAFESTSAVTPFLNQSRNSKRHGRPLPENLVEIQAPSTTSPILRGSLEREYGLQDRKQRPSTVPARHIQTAPNTMVMIGTHPQPKAMPSLGKARNMRPGTAPEMAGLMAHKMGGTLFSDGSTGLVPTLYPVPTSRNGLRHGPDSASYTAVGPAKFLGDLSIPVGITRVSTSSISITARAPLAQRGSSPPNRASRNYRPGRVGEQQQRQSHQQLSSNRAKHAGAPRFPVYRNICKTPSRMEAERDAPGAHTSAALLAEASALPDGSLGGGSNYKAWVPRQHRHHRVWAKKRLVHSSYTDREMLGGGFVAPTNRVTKNSHAPEALHLNPTSPQLGAVV